MSELETWMRRNRLRRAAKTLSTKVQAAQKRGSKSISVPIVEVEELLFAIEEQTE